MSALYHLPLLTLSCLFSPTYPGVQILDRTSVQQVLVEKGQVMAVETDRGSIECEYFVNCAGQVNGDALVPSYIRVLMRENLSN